VTKQCTILTVSSIASCKPLLSGFHLFPMTRRTYATRAYFALVIEEKKNFYET